MKHRVRLMCHVSQINPVPRAYACVIAAPRGALSTIDMSSLDRESTPRGESGTFTPVQFRHGQTICPGSGTVGTGFIPARREPSLREPQGRELVEAVGRATLTHWAFCGTG